MSAPLDRPGGVPRAGAAQLDAVRGANFNKQFGTKFSVKQGDTQLSARWPARSRRSSSPTGAILGVVGPSTSQAVISSGALFKKASLAAVSGSATRVSLTNGTIPTFFRVVPNDNMQAPLIANFLKTNLKAKTVVVMDSQDDYSKPLADGIQSLLKRGGVTVQRESVAATDTDFSSIVSKTPDDATAVVFATQTASAAQTLSNQLREQGKKAVVFATDGAYQPGAVQAEERLRVGLRARPEPGAGPEGARRPVQEVLEGQVVRRLRPAELPGRMGADDRDQHGLQGRQASPVQRCSRR